MSPTLDLETAAFGHIGTIPDASEQKLPKPKGTGAEKWPIWSPHIVQRREAHVSDPTTKGPQARTFLPTVPHLGTHLGTLQSKEAEPKPRSSLSLGDALTIAFQGSNRVFQPMAESLPLFSKEPYLPARSLGRSRLGRSRKAFYLGLPGRY